MSYDTNSPLVQLIVYKLGISYQSHAAKAVRDGYWSRVGGEDNRAEWLESRSETFYDAGVELAETELTKPNSAYI